MAKKDLSDKLSIPQGINVSREGDYIVFKGPKGEVKRKFDNPKIKVDVGSEGISLLAKAASKKEKAVINTYKAVISNAFYGCSELFTYELKICSGHFPMTVNVSDNFLVIKNFLGEKVPRKVKIKGGVKVEVSGDKVTVKGADKSLAGQVAADIEQATRRPGFDARIFQDGIYIIKKHDKEI